MSACIFKKRCKWCSELHYCFCTSYLFYVHRFIIWFMNINMDSKLKLNKRKVILIINKCYWKMSLWCRMRLMIEIYMNSNRSVKRDTIIMTICWIHSWFSWLDSWNAYFMDDPTWTAWAIKTTKDSNYLKVWTAISTTES